MPPPSLSPAPMRTLSQPAITGLAALAVVLAGAVYLPGIAGPYLFDDFPNILRNSMLRIDTLDTATLSGAAYSTDAGPLHRPVAMLSFALNYYFTGFDDPTPLKLTNLAIHVLNGLLLMLLLRAVVGEVERARVREPGDSRQPSRATWVAGAVALLWVLHPINLTSVLYVVQRMAQLSATFSLLALYAYLQGRLLMERRAVAGAMLGLAGFAAFGALALLSKENSVLLPVFVVLMELVVLQRCRPWSTWGDLPRGVRAALWVLGVAVLLGGLAVFVDFSLPRYVHRPFSWEERVLTEPRVVLLYLSLILAPRIDAFGLHHDDMALSTSMLTPWTTLPAILAIGLLVALGLGLRRRQPLLALGILWFFGAHLLESTILPLEIVHEHRNYLASAGVLLALVGALDLLRARAGVRLASFAFVVAAVVFGATTTLRAHQWSDYGQFVQYEVHHHPRSARALAALSALLDSQGQYAESLETLRRAWAIAPDEVAYLLNMEIAAAHAGESLTPEEREHITRLLTEGRISPSAQIALDNIASCRRPECGTLHAKLVEWTRLIVARENVPFIQSYYYFLMGRAYAMQGQIPEALNALQRSSELDSDYLHPLFEMASIFVQLEQAGNAELVLGWLREANARSPVRRDAEIRALEARVVALRADAGSGAAAGPP